MKHVSSILVCVHPDNPDPALVDRAVEIAKKNDAAVKAFHVISEYPEDMSEWWNVRRPEKLHERIVSEREAYLQTIVERFKQAGVEQIAHELRWGKHFLEIIKEVMRHKHDLVMITAKRRKLSLMMLDCPSADLLRHCPCPLWISRGGSPGQISRIMAAIGGKGGSVDCDGLNRRILRLAAAMAESTGSKLYLLHALPVYGGKGVKGKKIRADLVEHMDKLKETVFEQCASRLGDFDVDVTRERVQVLPGRPESVIPAYVASEGIDLVVMGTLARSGVPGLLLGGTAEKVFDQVTCSVLAVKAENFVSLVELEDERLDSGEQM